MAGTRNERIHWVIDKYQKHDAWLHWSVNERCNLNCAYCDSHCSPLKKTGKNYEINIPALMKALEKSGRIFKIRFTGGGEPFLVPNIIAACKEITKSHYIGFNTNLTCGNIRYFAENIDPEKVANINVSVHFQELERLNLVEKVIENFNLCKQKGFNIVASAVAYPPLYPKVRSYKKYFKEIGITVHFAYFMGLFNNREYPRSYTEEEIDEFDLNRAWLKKHYQYRGLCNAGYNAAIVDADGNVFPCQGIPDKIGNIYENFEFVKSLVGCPVKHCTCPLKQYDPYLFKRALRENSSIFRKAAPVIASSKFYLKTKFSITQAEDK